MRLARIKYAMTGRKVRAMNIGINQSPSPVVCLVAMLTMAKLMARKMQVVSTFIDRINLNARVYWYNAFWGVIFCVKLNVWEPWQQRLGANK